MKHPILTPMTTLLASLLLSACAGPSVQESAAQRQALSALEQDYNAGHYQQVAQTVGLSVELQTAPPSIQVPALKLQAFSYCLLKNTVQCKRSFEKLLQRYPDFDLPEAERSHPMWGPVFKQAKEEAGT